MAGIVGLGKAAELAMHSFEDRIIDWLASLRFSMLKTATEADVDYVFFLVPEAGERLREVSPVEAGILGELLY